MQIELEEFENGKPLTLKGEDGEKLTLQINQLRSLKKYKDILSLTSTMQQTPEKYLLAANALLHMRDWNGIIKTCDQGLQLAEEGEFYNLKGKAYGKLGDHESKIKLTLQAIKINPNVAAFYRNLGAAHYALKNYEQALIDHQQAIDREPNSAINYHNKGAAYFRMKEFSDARIEFEKAISKNPQLALSYSWCGDSHKQLGEPQKAYEYYKRAYEISGSDVYLKEKEKMEKLLKPPPKKSKGFFGFFSSD